MKTPNKEDIRDTAEFQREASKTIRQGRPPINPGNTRITVFLTESDAEMLAKLADNDLTKSVVLTKALRMYVESLNSNGL